MLNFNCNNIFNVECEPISFHFDLKISEISIYPEIGNFFVKKLLDNSKFVTEMPLKFYPIDIKNKKINVSLNSLSKMGEVLGDYILVVQFKLFGESSVNFALEKKFTVIREF